MMPISVTISDRLLQAFFAHTVLLRPNSTAPKAGSYGWLKTGQQISVSNNVRIEQNTGLYGGNYKPFVGGRPSCGLVKIGAFSYSYSALPGGVEIGRYCSISTGLKFIDSMHPLELITTSALTFRPSNSLYRDFATDETRDFATHFSAVGPKPYPRIQHDVWIGANVTLSMGIEIGTGAVIAANTTVTKDVPPYAIVGGNPGRVIRHRFEAELAERLTQSKWWDYDPKTIFSGLDNGPTYAVERIEQGDCQPFCFSSIELESYAS